jgi:hypothetical protein
MNLGLCASGAKTQVALVPTQGLKPCLLKSGGPGCERSAPGALGFRLQVQRESRQAIFSFLGGRGFWPRREGVPRTGFSP